MSDWPSGIGRYVFESIDSTNAEAARRVAQGETGPMWLASHQQTAGRGRQGREWRSPPGNLAATYVAPVSGGPAHAALFSFVAALAVMDTFRTLAPQQDIGLKWPNDVLLNRRKASGILLEGLGGAKAQIIAIGIGLNLSHHPQSEAANWPPTSILAETGTAPGFDAALETLAFSLATRIEEFEEDGFAGTREDWLANAVQLNEEITVRLPAGELRGTFAGLDTTGALVLEGADGRRLISAGDVFFPGAK